MKGKREERKYCAWSTQTRWRIREDFLVEVSHELTLSRHEVNLERGNRRGAVQADEEIRTSASGECGVSKGDGESIG